MLVMREPIVSLGKMNMLLPLGMSQYIAFDITIKLNIVDVKVSGRFRLRMRAFHVCFDKDTGWQRNTAFLVLFFGYGRRAGSSVNFRYGIARLLGFSEGFR